MKKIRFTAIIMALVCVMLVAGCTKAESATLFTCYNRIESVTKMYGEDEDNSAKHKIFALGDDGLTHYVDLYSSSAYSDDMANAISKNMNSLGVLGDGYEYQTITKAVSNLYFQSGYVKFMDGTQIDYDSKIDQSIKTQLYNDIDSLIEACKEVEKNKALVEIKVGPDTIEIDQNLRFHLDRYLKAYQDLIDKLYRINVDVEKIGLTILPIEQTYEKTTILAGSANKYICIAELHLGYYFYLKQMVLTGSMDKTFAHEQLKDTAGVSSNNKDYDEMFDNFKKICDQNVVPDLPDNKRLEFDIAVNLLNGFKTKMDDYKVAVDKIVAYKAANNGSKIPEDNINYSYVEFVNSMDTEANNLQNYIVNHLL